MSKQSNGMMQEKNVQHLATGQTITKVFVKFGTYLFLIVMAIIILFPFYWMILSSLKPCYFLYLKGFLGRGERM